MNWDFEKNVHYVHLCYSFPSLEWTLWQFYLLLLLSPMTFSVYWLMFSFGLAYRILVSPSWQSFFQYAIMLVYSVLRCILFVSAFERDSGQTAGQIGGSSVEAYWCGRERCLELIGETSLFFPHFFCYWSRLSFNNIDLYKYLWLFLLVVKLY